MSRSVRGPDYTRPAYTVVPMFKCYECATATTQTPDASGVSLCPKHQDGTPTRKHPTSSKGGAA